MTEQLKVNLLALSRVWQDKELSFQGHLYDWRDLQSVAW